MVRRAWLLPPPPCHWASARACTLCSCLPDKAPALKISHQVASNLRGDPQYALLRSLAPR